MKESHFARAARILKEAAGGRVTQPPVEIPKTQQTVRAVSIGNPSRLRQAYCNLARVIRVYLADPNDRTKQDVKEMLEICSVLEPECAPAQSPWFRTPGREDTTIFAKHRDLAAQASELLQINRHDRHWSRCLELVAKAVKEIE